MSQLPSLELPETLRQQLLDFRQRVWKSKMLEVLALIGVGLGMGLLVVFMMDRFIDTSRWVRGTITTITLGIWLLLPWAFYRWVWKQRRFDQLARLLRQRSPNFGDQLLGVIELSENPSEQARSPALCEAAMRQVAEQASKRDLSIAAPVSHHRRWGIVAITLGCVVIVLMLGLPAATWNAVSRLFLPWKQIDRYTFAQMDRLPDRLVVPHGESFSVYADLKKQTRWSPSRGSVSLAKNTPIYSSLESNHYHFSLPSLSADSSLDLRIGDFTHHMKIEPKLRPELTSLHADIRLPEYLQLPETKNRDLRGGSLSVVAGARVILDATANRNLQSAKLVGQLPVSGVDLATNADESTTETRQTLTRVSVLGVSAVEKQIQSEVIDIVEGVSSLAMSWLDEDGLTSRNPLRISVIGIPDAPPMVATEDLARQAIVLNSEQLNFRILATDDFGVRQVGLEWRELTEQDKSEANGMNVSSSRTLANGGPEQTSFVSQGTFRPIDLGIESKAIELRMWAEDYLPGRTRSYSLPHQLLVLTADEHAVWIAEQLNKWHRQSLDVRDRELQLYQTNKELRALPLSAFEDSKTRQLLESQAAGEAVNERRLMNLTSTGESLLRQAARNPELGVGHLERWAEVLKTLQDISSNRMPKVTDLLQQAARETKASNRKPKENGSGAGIVRNLPTSSPPSEASNEETNAKAKPPMPSIADVESSQQPASKQSPGDNTNPSKPSTSKLSLPTTVLIGPPQKPAPSPESPAQEKTEAAVHEQEDLLAEFEKLADEMNSVLGELEGSTLVKRLKAASREQTQVAQEIGKRFQRLLTESGITRRTKANDLLLDLSEMESKGSAKVSNIVDDLEAFYERRRSVKFKNVLKEMESSQVVSALRQLGDEIGKEQGMSIAQAEYWSDTMDRWAEDLVDPACKGSCPGCKNADSLPPSVVLEVLQMIEGQVNLREQTRVAEQAREAAGDVEHRHEASRIGIQQDELAHRASKVVEKIESLPEGNARFAKEIGQLSQAESLMVESVGLFQKPDTGSASLAIQTEIIELLLQSKRINPKSGGGAGKAPGGGGQGNTGDAALALLGAGFNPNEKRELREISQSTGQAGASLPEEFRDGLNQYFSRLENSPSAERTKP